MIQRKYLQNTMIAAVAVAFGSAQVVPGADQNGPIVKSAISIVKGPQVDSMPMVAPLKAPSRVASALEAFQGLVRPLSHSRALTDAFGSYFAYKAAHPEQVRKPLLYFVDYGLPSTTPRGYVFDMEALKVVDGPFMVAHGRGSAAPNERVPTRFSNRPNSYATSLGLYVAQ
jgi:hypothetical protein